MNKISAALLSVTFMTLAGCEAPVSDDDALSTERGRSQCTQSKSHWRTYNEYGEGDEYMPWPSQSQAYNWFGWREDSPVLYGDADEVECPDRGTYYEVLMTPAKGDRWLVLAHKYIVAKLNLTSGASTSEGWELVLDAREILSDCQVDPDEWPAALEIAIDLHGYNEGEWGPGACEATKTPTPRSNPTPAPLFAPGDAGEPVDPGNTPPPG